MTTDVALIPSGYDTYTRAMPMEDSDHMAERDFYASVVRSGKGAAACIPLTGEMRILCVNSRRPPRSLSGVAGRIGASGLPPDKRIGDS
jgi:hypothetical protein